MKVLFIASGNANTPNGITSIVYNQGESLRREGIEVDYFGIKGKGIAGYIKNIKPIRSLLKKGQYDIVHSHYSLSSFTVSIASFGLRIPQVSSLMGSDIQTNYFMKQLIKLFCLFCWNITIVKSEKMKETIGLDKCEVIPNGVDLKEFIPDDQIKYKKRVGFNLNKKQIIWVSNPNRYEKNFELAEKAVKMLNNDNVELVVVTGKPHSEVKEYMLASGMLLLSSRWEGSPNVVKEAMALNVPIVSTNVGDVGEIINDTEGCFVVEQDVEEMSEAIDKCLKFNKRTNGREIISHLSSSKIAEKLIKIYKALLKN